MIDPVTFILQGQPRGQERTGGNGKRRFTEKKTRAYEAGVGTMATLAMRGRPVITEPVALCLRAVFAIPASWSQKKKDRALLGEIKPAVKPDLDNIIKAVCDGMNKIVLRDDSQVVDLSHCKKVYGITPMVAVTIKDAAGC